MTGAFSFSVRTSARCASATAFQFAALFDSLTIGENVALPLREHTKLSDAEIGRRVSETLESVGLGNVEQRYPAELSGGMVKRAGFARAVVTGPQCVLYDEPTTGLDPITSDSINHMIRRLQRRLGVTSIVVTHDMKTAFHCADRVALLHEGRVHFDGSVEELKASTDPVITDFIVGRSGESD